MVSFLILLLVVGFVVYMVQAAPFIHPFFKTAVIGILCIMTIIALLNALGINTGVHFPLR